MWVLAARLARLIESKSDRPHIGFMLPTGGLAPATILATWMLGRTTVPINYLLQTAERDAVIDDAELDLVITVTPMIERFGAIRDDVTTIALDKVKDQLTGFPIFRRIPKLDDDHLAVLLYTSGTSGLPKGVMLTAGNIDSNIRQAQKAIGFGRDYSFLGVIPQFHSFGLTVLTLLPLACGPRSIMTARFQPRKLLDLMRKHRPTAMILIPSMYNALLAQKKATREDFSSLKLAVSGGEPLPEAVAEGFFERFGVRINEGYGLTETSPVTNVCLPQTYRKHSVGLPMPELEQRIVADDGRVLGPNEDGEVRFRGPNIMKGYYNRPEETAAVFDDEGFFRTGDIGRVDDDGHLYITGRLKEMIIVGGENVFPREIEEVLNMHPSVHASAVIGLADPSRGEVPLAFVEMSEDADFDETQLRSWCRDKLATYKVPRDIRVIDELPRNPTGKILRRALTADVS